MEFLPEKGWDGREQTQYPRDSSCTTWTCTCSQHLADCYRTAPTLFLLQLLRVAYPCYKRRPWVREGDVVAPSPWIESLYSIMKKHDG